MNPKSSLRLQQWIVCLALIVGPGCDPEDGYGCGSSSSTEPPAETDTLTYIPQHMHIWATIAMDANTPMTSVPVIDHYGIYPELPAGLTLDPRTGTISGAPSAELAETEYSIVAYGTAGESPQTTVTIEIYPAIAPEGLTYTPSSVAGPWGSALPTMDAQYTGVAQSFSVEPALHEYQAIDPADGTITGGFFGLTGLTHHTVTVTNPFGSSQAEIDIEVTPADIVNGLLVPSANDRTLDVYSLRGQGYAPIDAEYLAGAAAIDVVATKDGRFLYVAASNGKLYEITRDRVSGYCEPPLELEGASPAYKLAITPDDAFLIAAFDFVVKRYPIQAGGSLGEPTQVPGPFGPSSLRIAGADRLLVASSYPGQVWCYDIAPALELRGPHTELGPELSVVRLLAYGAGANAFAITTIYDRQTHELNGQIRSLLLSTDAEIAAGFPAVVQSAVVEHGANLSDACLGSELDGFHLLVTDESAGQLYDFEVDVVAGTLEPDSLSTWDIGGNPTRVLRLPGVVTLVLDGQAAEIARYTPGFSAEPFVLRSRTRTRTYPSALLALNGAPGSLSSETLFLSSAQDSTLRSLRTDPSTPGLLSLSAQGPVATGSGPLDVEASAAGPYVYTADASGATISAFRFDEATLALTTIEAESLSPGTQPCALALTPSGSHLYALDATGSVIALRVDPGDGSLTQTGSVAIEGSLNGAFLRMDPLARFVFVVQPALGRITSLRLSLPFGQPAWASALDSLADPVDLLASIDGRFVSVLERGAARVRTFEIAGATGALGATGSTMPSGVAPIGLTNRRAVGIYEPDGVETLRVFDPQQQFVIPIERVQLTSDLHTGFDFTSLLSQGTHTLIPVSDWSNPDSYTYGTGLIGLSPAGLDQRLSLYRYEPPPGANSYVETDSLLLGAGPHALATRTRSSAR